MSTGGKADIGYANGAVKSTADPLSRNPRATRVTLPGSPAPGRKGVLLIKNQYRIILLIPNGVFQYKCILYAVCSMGPLQPRFDPCRFGPVFPAVRIFFPTVGRIGYTRCPLFHIKCAFAGRRSHVPLERAVSRVPLSSPSAAPFPHGPGGAVQVPVPFHRCRYLQRR